MLKTFPGPDYLFSEDLVVWLWNPLANLYIWLTISSCSGSILLDLGLIGRNGPLTTLCGSYIFRCQQRLLKRFPCSGYLHSKEPVFWVRYPVGNLYIWVTISSCYGSSLLALVLIKIDGTLSTLSHSCGFASQQRVLKTFSGTDYLHSEDSVVWLCHPLVNLYVWITISPCHGTICLASGSIGRDGGLSTLCHNCRFACQKRVLKMFPCPGYLHSEDGLVWLWHP